MCDLKKGTAAGLRRALFQSELKNSFGRSRNRYRRFASARSQSTDSPPKKKLWEDISKKKKNMGKITKKKKKISLGRHEKKKNPMAFSS